MYILLLIVIIIQPGCVQSNAREAEFQQKRAAYYAEEKRKESLPLQRQFTFNPVEHESFLIKGDAALSGEAFLRTRGGDVRYAAGSNVFLIPATDYGREYIEKDLLLPQKEKIPVLDTRIYESIRSVRADSKGRFTFSDLPGGNYLVFTTIFWEIPKSSRYGSYSTSTGGPIVQTIELRSGEQKSVILTQ